MKNNKNINSGDKNRCTTIFYWISGFSLLISIVAFCGAYIFKDLVVEKESIVLIFIGILATFIVVGNYAQVKDIQRGFESKIKVVAAIQTTPVIKRNNKFVIRDIHS